MSAWLLLYGSLVLAWVFLLSRMRFAYRRPRDPAGGPLWLVLLGLTIAPTVSIPPVAGAIERVSGVADLDRLLEHAGILLVAWAAQVFLWRMSHPASVRPRSWLRAACFAGVLITMAVLFALAPRSTGGAEFASWEAPDTPWALEYYLVYLAYLTPVFVQMARAGLRYARQTANPVLRLALLLVSVGATSALFYKVLKALFFASYRFGFPYPAFLRNQLVEDVLPFIAHLLVLVGVTMPVWGPRVGLPGLADALHRYRTYQRLRPLWRALYLANPHIALVPPPSALADVLTVRDLSLRTYRRVIEIRDGRLALQPYLDPCVAAAARSRAQQAGLSGQALDAAVEADVLHATLTAKALGLPPVPETNPTVIPGGDHVDSDTAFLSDVARAYRRCRRMPVHVGT